MPFDPLFKSKVRSPRIVEASDAVERERLHSLPFEEGKAEYNRIKKLIRQRVFVARGEFLFVRDIDQKRNHKKNLAWNSNKIKYCKGNVLPESAYSNLHKS